MKFGRTENNGDYIVSAYFQMPSDGCCQWHHLRNFGSRQGDAIEFMEYDCPKLPYEHIVQLAKRYDASVRWKRVSGDRFVRQGF